MIATISKENKQPVHREMYLSRKSLEVIDLKKLEYLSSFIFNEFSHFYNGKERDEEMDKFWAKELAAAEVFYAHGYDYEVYLPGRYFTYKRLVDILQDHEDIKGKSILEVGCGSGLALVMLAKRGVKCIGLDKSYVALEFLRRNVEKEGLDSIVRNQGDFFSMVYDDNQFDISYNLGVFEHLDQKDQERLIKEMARITKGIIFIIIPNPDSPLFKTLLYHEQELDSIAPGNIYPDRHKHFHVDLTDLLASGGFQVLGYSGISLAPSQDLNPKTLDDDVFEFFDKIPKIIPMGEGKERIINLMRFWQCVEKATSSEDLIKYAWFRYVIGRKSLD